MADCVQSALIGCARQVHDLCASRKNDVHLQRRMMWQKSRGKREEVVPLLHLLLYTRGIKYNVRTLYS